MVLLGHRPVAQVMASGKKRKKINWLLKRLMGEWRNNVNAKGFAELQWKWNYLRLKTEAAINLSYPSCSTCSAHTSFIFVHKCNVNFYLRSNPFPIKLMQTLKFMLPNVAEKKTRTESIKKWNHINLWKGFHRLSAGTFWMLDWMWNLHTHLSRCGWKVFPYIKILGTFTFIRTRVKVFRDKT